MRDGLLRFWVLGVGLALAAGTTAPARTVAPRASGAPVVTGARVCPDAPGLGDGDPVKIWISPLTPSAGRPLGVLAVAEEAEDAAEIVVTAPTGRKAPMPTTRRGGAPWSYQAAVASPTVGRNLIELSRNGKILACRTVDVAPRGRGPLARKVPATGGTWSATRAWDRSMESFYSAWIESLFDAPPGASLGFLPLAQALRDRERNWLFDYLGLGEDDPKGKGALPASPDCADLPYFLRAYFSWKLGLPFGLRDCDRGTDSRPPRCGELITNEAPVEATTQAAARDGGLGAMKRFLRLLANKVHSGSARTALADENTDTYPVPLTRDALRPGTVFADPYGHVLMLVKWVEQRADAGGMLLAVDGQPDGSVGRKRFWEGTFLYANDVVGAGPGFKAFRPLVRGADGQLAPLGNAALRADRRFAPFSTEQQGLDRDAFYARMSKLVNPRGLDASTAYRETLDALVEQLQTRVGSVANGERYVRDSRYPEIAMPEGAKIFETIGPWEDYATPSRDMRLLIAIHVLETLPVRIVERPELFNLGARKPAAARAEVERQAAAAIEKTGIEYRRSDGSPFRLTVADVLGRKAGFEIAYNPNDCVEIRWAAPEGSAEASTCKRRAPEAQRARMAELRSWFHEMRRPAR